MRKRALTTTKVLTVALLSNVGCSKPQVQADPPSAAVAPATATAATSTSEPTKVEDPKLVALRTELEDSMREDVMKQLAHYRPLCDQDGYPLVGNLARKSPGMEPSELCSEIRKQKH